MIGGIRILISAGGTDSSDPNSLAKRWLASPYSQFEYEYARACNWLDANNLPRRICFFQPDGYPRAVTMNFRARPLMTGRDPEFTRQTAAIVRDFSPDCDMLIYCGCFAEYNWRTRQDIVECIGSYACQGQTSIALDQMADETEAHGMRPLDGMAFAFNRVCCEGQYRTANPWMRDAGYPNIVMGNWQPNNAGLYLPPQDGDAMLCTVVTKSMKDAKATDEECNAWRRQRASQAIQAGQDAIISVTALGEATYLELAGA